jgi:hypothetical protein
VAHHQIHRCGAPGGFLHRRHAGRACDCVRTASRRLRHAAGIRPRRAVPQPRRSWRSRFGLMHTPRRWFF